MKISDKLYGTVEINSPVLLALLQSAPIQRLRFVGQFGLPEQFYAHKGFSRFEHSVGVMLLLGKLGANEKEQIAGLLHDVAHTVFSHVADWIFSDGGEENYHDKKFLEYITSTKIVQILKDHGYSPENFINLSSFPLLEQEIPHLCADRLDYALREMPEKLSQKYIADLVVIERKIVFKSLRMASQFSKRFLQLQQTRWGASDTLARYLLLAHVLRTGLRKSIITETDFWTTDHQVYRKLEDSNEKEITDSLLLLALPNLDHLPTEKRIIKKKFRYVDPCILTETGLHRLSEMDIKFAKDLFRAKINSEKGIHPILIQSKS